MPTRTRAAAAGTLSVAANAPQAITSAAPLVSSVSSPDRSIRRAPSAIFRARRHTGPAVRLVSRPEKRSTSPSRATSGAAADADANFVLLENGHIAEAQATAEGATYDEEALLRLLRLARIGCTDIFAAQARALA